MLPHHLAHRSPPNPSITAARWPRFRRRRCRRRPPGRRRSCPATQDPGRRSQAQPYQCLRGTIWRMAGGGEVRRAVYPSKRCRFGWEDKFSLC